MQKSLKSVLQVIFVFGNQKDEYIIFGFKANCKERRDISIMLVEQGYCLYAKPNKFVLK